jgi:hypothetical protein
VYVGACFLLSYLCVCVRLHLFRLQPWCVSMCVRMRAYVLSHACPHVVECLTIETTIFEWSAACA